MSPKLLCPPECSGWKPGTRLSLLHISFAFRIYSGSNHSHPVWLPPLSHGCRFLPGQRRCLHPGVSAPTLVPHCPLPHRGQRSLWTPESGHSLLCPEPSMAPISPNPHHSHKALPALPCPLLPAFTPPTLPFPCSVPASLAPWLYCRLYWLHCILFFKLFHIY